MTASDAQIEIALLASIERQAARTAAALERVDRLLRRVREAKREGRAAARPKRKAGAA
jgi:hypothetical protein